MGSKVFTMMTKLLLSPVLMLLTFNVVFIIFASCSYYTRKKYSLILSFIPINGIICFVFSIHINNIYS